jgi:hypothetical protein
MRLGLLGPALDRDDALERAMRFLRQAGAQRVVYLDVDGAVDRVIRRWAEALVGPDPAENAIFDRAAEHCLRAGPDRIDKFVAAERARRELSLFESLAGDGTRAIEILNNRVVVMIHDKANLVEEDIVSASVFVFGKAREPLVKQVGSRWFLSPGGLDQFGLLTLEDLEDGIHLTLYDNQCNEHRRERLVAPRGPKLRVSGEGG